MTTGNRIEPFKQIRLDCFNNDEKQSATSYEPTWHCMQSLCRAALCGQVIKHVVLIAYQDASFVQQVFFVIISC